MTNFLIKKWYFDGVSEDGKTLIFYSAILIWHSIKVQYINYLYLGAQGDVRSESRYSNAQEPVIQGNKIFWKDEGLKIFGEWESDTPPLRAMLHNSQAGYLDWNCFHPAARCHLHINNEPILDGYGYVECLEMTVPPWKMGFNELRWGRFANPDSPIVWIELRGPSNFQWVFDGQTRIENAIISDEMIELPHQHKKLMLSEPTAIEDKEKILEVVNSLVKWLPGFKSFTPFRFLRARESKWRSRGVLTSVDEKQHTGWVIHELVKF